MYNLAKLLTEEPKKIEKLLILFSKLILTFYLTSSIYSFKFSFLSVVENPIPKDLTTEKIIYFFSSLVIVWYVCWNLIVGGILTLLPIWLITRNKNGKETADAFLRLVDVASSVGNSYIRRKNIIEFENDMDKVETLKEFEEYDDRFKEYYMLSLTTFLSLLFFSDVHLPGWTIYFFISLITGFFVLSILVSLAHKYFTDNWTFLRNEFKSLAYYQKVSNVICESKIVKNQYDVLDLNRIIHLNIKNGITNPHSEILVHVNFSTSDFLAGQHLHLMLRSYDNVQHTAGRLIIVICNKKPDERNLQEISQNPMWIYLQAKTELQILNRFEESMARSGLNVVI